MARGLGRVRGVVVAIAVAVTGIAQAATPVVPEPVAVPTELPPAVRDALEAQRKALAVRAAALATDVAEHDVKCRSVPADDSARIGACHAALKFLQERFSKHRAAVEVFNRSVSDALVRVVVTREQDELDRTNERWLRAQEQRIREAVAAGRAWRMAMLESLRNIQVPEPTHRPKSLDDVLPGDVLLFEAAPGFSAAIPPADYFYRVASDLARGDVLAAAAKRPAAVSHALTFVKRVNGVMLFLDHTSEGSRILDRRELTRKYDDRKVYVARPQTTPDGRALWAAARQAALRNRPYYGVLPGQQVCSEQACVVVAKATGTPMANHRLGPIDITPADFFDREAIGKYFIVSPLEP